MEQLAANAVSRVSNKDGTGMSETGLATEAAQRESLSDRAYQSIRASLMACELHPGHRLILRPLAQQLGLSPTPVREALLRLVSEQALTLDERGSATVPVMSAECFEELIALRGDLESRAIERAVAQATDAQLAELKAINAPCLEAYARHDALEAMSHNLNFHRAICLFGRSMLTLHALEGLWLRLGPTYAPRIGGPLPSFEDGKHPHEHMLDALNRRDVQAARDAAMIDVMAAYNYANPHPSAA